MSLNVSFVLALLSVAAFVGPLVGEIVSVPGAVIELLIGIGLSRIIPSADYSTTSVISSLGELGFLILMFLVGLEIDFRQLLGAARGSVAMGVGLFVTSLGVSALVLGHLAGASPIWVLAGAATSVGITVPVLYVQGWMGQRFGHDVLLMGSVTEVVYLGALNILSVASRHDSITTSTLLGSRVAVFFAFTFVLVRLFQRSRSRVPRHFHRWFRRDDPIEVGLRGTFALLFVVVAFAGVIRIPTVLGALLAGVIFRGVIGNARAIVERLTSVANSFFIPLFFLTVGLQTPLRASVLSLLPLIGLLLVVVSVSRLVVVPYLRHRGHSWRMSFAGAAMLMAPLTLLVTTAEIGRSAGFLGPRNYSAIIFVAVLSSIIFPVVARILLPAYGDELAVAQSFEGGADPAPST
ncbi:MAG: hypothetical protein HIU57_04375 [Acidobacteria bacterium]|nr:hypothetical protein [Acidobacteriota bacterium]